MSDGSDGSDGFQPFVNPDHLPPALTTADGHWYVIDRRANLLLVDGEIPSGLASPVEPATVHLLGVDGDTPVWAVAPADPTDRDGDGVFPPGGTWLGLRRVYGAVPEHQWALAGRAAQIIAWERDHQFCGRCGRPTDAQPAERARVCGHCTLLAYPRLSPAVIVLVERDDGRALLAWGRQFPGRFYSALAGFVEPGESLEQTVAREIKEEVGIDVADVRYFGSQPWPFPHSMMIGFTARYAGGEITIQEDEIVEADWYRHDELPPTPRGGISIAGWLIEDWINRQG